MDEKLTDVAEWAITHLTHPPEGSAKIPTEALCTLLRRMAAEIEQLREQVAQLRLTA